MNKKSISLSIAILIFVSLIFSYSNAVTPDYDTSLFKHPKTVAKKVSITINASKQIKKVTPFQFGINLPNISGAQEEIHKNALTELGNMTVRYPGGLVNDIFDWTSPYGTDGGIIPTGWEDFVKLCKDIGIPYSKVQIGVNYGTKPISLAVAWVKDANITKKLGIKYWEIGNEQWYSTEPDLHGTTLPDGTVLPGKAHDAETYGTESAKFYKAMKEVDPTIKIGVHINDNPYADTVYKAMKKQGVMPDYVIYHCYPLGPMADDITTLTHSSNYLKTLSTNIKNAIKGVYGSDSKNVEVFLNEYNSTWQPGKQTASLINGLYLADVVGSSLYEDVQNVSWFAYRHTMSSIAFSGNNDSGLYGWRRAINGLGKMAPYGDMQLIMTEKNDKYPTFYMTKLMNRFIADEDTLVELPVTKETFLTSAALKGKDGSLKVLIINKTPSTIYNAALNLKGYTASGKMTAYSYGIPNDDAAGTGFGNPDLSVKTVNVKGSSINYSFQPYSATVLVIGGESRDIIPPKAVKLSPTGEVTSGSIALNWNSSQDAHHYDVFYRPNGFTNTYWTLADSIAQNSITIDGLRNGTKYTFMVKAVDVSGNSSAKSNIVEVSTTKLTKSLPYSNTPVSIPSIIEVVNYDEGGEGLAYHDAEPANLGNEGRVKEGVDMQTCSLGGMNIGWTNNNEWLNYSINVPEDGKYNFIIKVASAGNGGDFHVELNNKNISGKLTIANTTGWQEWEDITIKNVSLKKGNAQLKLFMEKSNIMTTGYVGNFKTITIEKVN